MPYRAAPALFLVLASTAAAAPAARAQSVPDTVVCTITAMNKCVGTSCSALTFGNRSIRVSMTDRTACVRVGSNPACSATWKFEIARRSNTEAVLVFPAEVQLFYIRANGLFRGTDLNPDAEFTFSGTCQPAGSN